jgi:hypothetical protein
MMEDKVVKDQEQHQDQIFKNQIKINNYSNKYHKKRLRW